jgi:hypothetical protein
MGESQESLTNLYGWSCVAAVSVYFALFLAAGTLSFLLSWIRGVYAPKGQEQFIDFSSDHGNYIFFGFT